MSNEIGTRLPSNSVRQPFVRLGGWTISTQPSHYEPPNRQLVINSLGTPDTTKLNDDWGDGYVKFISNLDTGACMWLNWKGDLFWSSTGDWGNKISIIDGNTPALKAFHGKVKDSNNVQVVTVQQPAVEDSTVDLTSVSTQLNALLAALRTHGLIAS